MALVALLFAHHAVVGATEPFASIAVAGLSSVERQARLSRNLGAARVLVVAERMPPALAAALARLGGEIAIVRDPALLGGSLDDEDRVLVFEEGLLPDESAAAHFLAQAQPDGIAVATGEPPYPQAERLDSSSFWAGMAIYDAPLVRAVAADLGEWDLQSTLLRSAVGEGLSRIAVGEGALQSVRDERAAERAGSLLMAASSEPRSTWPARYLYPPIEHLAVRALLPTRATGAWLWGVALACGALAIVTFAAGWLWLGLALALATEPLAGVGDRLARIRLDPLRRDTFDRAMMLVIEPGWYLGLAYCFAAGGFDGAWAVAALIVAFRWAAERQRFLFQRLAGAPFDAGEARERRLALFAAAPETLPWALLPFAPFGEWLAGFVVLAAYSTASFFLTQSAVFRRLGERTRGS